MEFAADAISPNHNLRAAAATTIAPLIAAPQEHQGNTRTMPGYSENCQLPKASQVEPF